MSCEKAIMATILQVPLAAGRLGYFDTHLKSRRSFETLMPARLHLRGCWLVCSLGSVDEAASRLPTSHQSCERLSPSAGARIEPSRNLNVCRRFRCLYLVWRDDPRMQPILCAPPTVGLDLLHRRSQLASGLAAASQRPRSRPMTSRMISFDPAQILVTRASFQARAARYSFM